MLTAILSVLGAVIGAIIAALTVGWTYSVGWGVDGHSVFNPVALVFVGLGLALGILTGYLLNKLFSTIKDNKNGPSYSVADEINKLEALLDSGTITKAEFEAEKNKILKK